MCTFVPTDRLSAKFHSRFYIELGKLKTGKSSNYLISKESNLSFKSYTK